MWNDGDADPSTNGFQWHSTTPPVMPTAVLPPASGAPLMPIPLVDADTAGDGVRELVVNYGGHAVDVIRANAAREFVRNPPSTGLARNPSSPSTSTTTTAMS